MSGLKLNIIPRPRTDLEAERQRLEQLLRREEAVLGRYKEAYAAGVDTHNIPPPPSSWPYKKPYGPQTRAAADSSPGQSVPPPSAPWIPLYAFPRKQPSAKCPTISR